MPYIPTIHKSTLAGASVYIMLRRESDRKYWQWDDVAFDTLTASRNFFANSLTEVADGLFYDASNILAASGGLAEYFTIEYYHRAGGSPDPADELIAIETGYYDGIDLLAQSRDVNVVSSGGTFADDLYIELGVGGIAANLSTIILKLPSAAHLVGTSDAAGVINAGAISSTAVDKIVAPFLDFEIGESVSESISESISDLETEDVNVVSIDPSAIYDIVQSILEYVLNGSGNIGDALGSILAQRVHKTLFDDSLSTSSQVGLVGGVPDNVRIGETLVIVNGITGVSEAFYIVDFLNVDESNGYVIVDHTPSQAPAPGDLIYIFATNPLAYDTWFRIGNPADTFISNDIANLQAIVQQIRNKCPGSTYLAGTNNASGAIQLNDVTGAWPTNAITESSLSDAVVSKIAAGLGAFSGTILFVESQTELTLGFNSIGTGDASHGIDDCTLAIFNDEGTAVCYATIVTSVDAFGAIEVTLDREPVFAAAVGAKVILLPPATSTIATSGDSVSEVGCNCPEIGEIEGVMRTVLDDAELLVTDDTLAYMRKFFFGGKIHKDSSVDGTRLHADHNQLLRTSIGALGC
jgi:hypothetical protein